MNEEYIKELKEKIRTINPKITNELLDLLYEFIMCQHIINFTKNVDTNDIQNLLNYVMNPLGSKKCED